MTPAEFLILTVQKYVGCSYDNRRGELQRLIARGVDNPKTCIIRTTSTCGLFALGIMKEIEVPHQLLSKSYQTGAAIAWVRKIGADRGARRLPGEGTPTAGALMHYYTPGKNDNHVEWLMSDVDSSGMADHAGGGRSNCEVGAARSNIFSNYFRPLQEWYDINALTGLS
jgi:hypothetical protein